MRASRFVWLAAVGLLVAGSVLPASATPADAWNLKGNMFYGQSGSCEADGVGDATGGFGWVDAAFFGIDSATVTSPIHGLGIGNVCGDLEVGPAGSTAQFANARGLVTFHDGTKAWITNLRFVQPQGCPVAAWGAPCPIEADYNQDGSSNSGKLAGTAWLSKNVFEEGVIFTMNSAQVTRP